MQVLEYKLDGTPKQYAAIDEAIRVTQFVRNKCLRLWMDAKREDKIDKDAMSAHSAVLAHDFDFAQKLNSQARQAAAERAWASVSRFYDNCQNHKPGKKGYPQFQHDGRSAEYKVTGWKLDPDGKHLTFTDGLGIGRLRMLGTRMKNCDQKRKKPLRTPLSFPLKDIKRVRLIRRAAGYSVQFCIDTVRQVVHELTGKQRGIDMGLKEFYTDSEGQTVANPRFLRQAEAKIITLQRRVSKKWCPRKPPKDGKPHKKRKQRQNGKKPVGQNHQARKHAARNKYPRQMPLPDKAPVLGEKQSNNYKKAVKQLAKAHLKVQRQREDFARKKASALVESSDLIAHEDLKIANMVSNHKLAKSISDAAWGRFLRWVSYYAELHGIPVVAVPPQYTSQNCSGCGKVVQKTLSTRTHRCIHCGLVLDRDHNAAINILMLALALLARDRTAGQVGTRSDAVRTKRLGSHGHHPESSNGAQGAPGR